MLFIENKHNEIIPFQSISIFQVVKGAAGVVGDALTFKWAQANMAQVAVNTVVVTEVINHFTFLYY